jgi:hypothetical protein
MFSHIMIGANDVKASKVFYDAILGELGHKPGVMVVLLVKTHQVLEVRRLVIFTLLIYVIHQVIKFVPCIAWVKKLA